MEEIAIRRLEVALGARRETVRGSPWSGVAAARIDELATVVDDSAKCAKMTPP